MTNLVRFDWAIKYLLKNKANFDILEGFLSELLKTPIHIEQILESESNKNHAKDKFNRVDLLVKTDRGEQIVIEVQCSSQWDYLSRILYGTSKLVCEQLDAGKAYGNIHKVISVNIVFFDLGEGKDYLYKGSTTFVGMHYHDILGLNAREKRMYYQNNELQLETPSPQGVFPEYYIIKVTQFQERVKDKLDEWIYFLKHGKIEENFHAKGLQSAAKKLDVLRLSEEERRAYEAYQEGLHDEASLSSMLNITASESHAQGLAAGLAEGREEGLVEGGKAMQLQIAKSLKQSGFPDEKIAELTQLSLVEISSIGSI